MQLDEYKVILESSGVDQKKIEEIVSALKPLEGAISNISEEDVKKQILKLQNEVGDEKDWEKKAQKAAKIISLGLE